VLCVFSKVLTVLWDGAMLNGDKVMVPLSEESSDSTDTLSFGPGVGTVSEYGSQRQTWTQPCSSTLLDLAKKLLID
jgi:hypothetical protein